ncbi:MAG TPA: amylo-alpha-1,6-glucosidase [Candidatus Acidoferrum sp.]
MGDIIRVKGKYYVLASSALADDRTRVLKYGDTFGVFNRDGDIEAAGRTQLGLFHTETRHLDRMTVRLDGRTPLLLSSTVRNDNAFLSVDLTNVDIDGEKEDGIQRGTLHVYRCIFLDDGVCYQQLRLANYGLTFINVGLSLKFSADYADIFEVRGTPRRKKGRLLPATVDTESVKLSYLGLDQITRSTSIHFSPAPDSLTEKTASYQVRMKPSEESAVLITVVCERSPSHKSVRPYADAFASKNLQCRQEILDGCRIRASNKRFDEWLTRSEADLRMLIQGNPEGAYPYAGVPWFNTVFGRDGIVTALECLWVAPSIAEGVLRYLASTQATEAIPEQDAEPGKIVHEVRRGEMAALKEVPFGRYYGSVDSTPLFVLLAGAYFLRTNNLDFLKNIWPNIIKALDWIDRCGDQDKDGFVEYARKSADGLTQQGWKDSGDSIFHADGILAEAPIALCEVQGYVFAAKLTAALAARALGDAEFADKLERQACDLQKRFESQFWNDKLRSYVLALDGNKKQCLVRTSNAGHALLCKIASPERAAITAETLLSERMFSGWGVRTVASGESRYNPMSYHNGSIWPHDNALIALGLSLYGHQSKVLQIIYGLYEASLHVELNRLPELFCGFHKRGDSSGPTLYPVACSPQAWAAGSVFLLLRAALGISIRAPERTIRLSNPVLPSGLDELTIENLRVAGATVDLLIRRHPEGVGVEVLRRDGDIEVVKSV